ncbi:hypothetical protein MferCBS31731_004092 [Microsporum ferrugineum]
MASDDSVDYKALFLQAEERAKQVEEHLRQADEHRRRADELRKQADEQRIQADEQRIQADEQRKQAEERLRQDQEHHQKTSLDEFLRECHRLLSLPIRVQDPQRATKGGIPAPTNKFCPTFLRRWTDCDETLANLYRAVYHHLQPDRLFSSLAMLEYTGRRSRPLASEKDLEFSERLTVELHVEDIITELCRRPAARAAFDLGEGVMFENHPSDIDEEERANRAGRRRPIPDQFCIHQIRDGNATLLTTVEYKPPHKLQVEYLCAGLRPMNLWEEVVQRPTIPTDTDEKLVYNAERISASVLVQEYHVMITEGLEYSYITNGLAYILLYIDYRTPETLYYHFCVPNQDVKPGDSLPWTSIARVLCICLISCRSAPLDQNQRNEISQGLHTWNIDFNTILAEIPEEELRQTPPGSEYVPSPTSSFTENDHRPITRSQARCAPQDTATNQFTDPDSDHDPDRDPQHAALGRKRNLSDLTASSSSSSQQQESHRSGGAGQRGHRHQQRYQHTAEFCTQRCLLGLQRGANLDSNCPNIDQHRQGNDSSDRHPISADHLVRLINQQLDKDLNHNCTPFGFRGGYGQPFKVTCREYGYTVVGKGTTDLRWDEVRRETEVYRVLYTVQGSAVPVFLGPIDMKMTYHVHGAGSIRHMLLMGWGGQEIDQVEYTKELAGHIKRSRRQLLNLGVVHGDLRDSNMLWNSELRKVLIIDFHRSRLILPTRNGKNKSLKHSTDDVKRSGTGKRARASLREILPSEC